MARAYVLTLLFLAGITPVYAASGIEQLSQPASNQPVQLKPSITPTPSLQTKPPSVLQTIPTQQTPEPKSTTDVPLRPELPKPSLDSISQPVAVPKTSGQKKPARTPKTAPGKTPPSTYTLQGSASKSVTISDALNEALLNNPRTEAIRRQLGIAKSAYWQALTFPNPSLALINGYGGLSFQQAVNIPIEPPWKVIFRLLTAKKQVAQSKLEISRDLWLFRGEIRRSFTELALSQETAETLADLADLSQRLLDVAQKRFKAGDVPELDLFKARLAAAQADIEKKQGEMRMIRAAQQLNVALARTVEETIKVPRLPLFRLRAEKTDEELGTAEQNDLLPDLTRPMPPLKDYVDLALKNRLELKITNKQIEVASAQLKSAIGNIVPTPEFMFGRDFSGNPPVPVTGPDPTVGLLFNVLIELPVLNFQQGAISQLRATIKQLRSQIKGQSNTIVGEVSSAYNNLITARERIRSYQEHVLFESYEVARLARRSYEVGQSDITSTLMAQQANVSIRREYLNAIMDYQLAFTALEQAVGTPLN